MEIHFSKILREHSEQLANFLAAEEWPYFMSRSQTRQQVMTRIEDGDFFGEGEENFFVLSEGNPIGLIELYQLEDLAPMFSIRLQSQFRGNGLGQKILSWVTDYIFKTYPDKRRIEAQTREDNIVMRKLFAKCGYVKEAYYRFASPTENNERVASVGYGILREDWESKLVTPVSWQSDSFYTDSKATFPHSSEIDETSPFANTPKPPYYAVIFTSLRSHADDKNYQLMAKEMSLLATKQPGYLGQESVRDSSGVGITISYWKTAESIIRWKQNADHLSAQDQGKSKWYQSYHVRISNVERAYSFESSLVELNEEKGKIN